MNIKHIAITKYKIQQFTFDYHIFLNIYIHDVYNQHPKSKIRSFAKIKKKSKEQATVEKLDSHSPLFLRGPKERVI